SAKAAFSRRTSGARTMRAVAALGLAVGAGLLLPVQGSMAETGATTATPATPATTPSTATAGATCCAAGRTATSSPAGRATTRSSRTEWSAVGEALGVCHSFTTWAGAASSLRTITTEPAVSCGGGPAREKPYMRKNPLLPFALTCAALLLGAGPALADGSSPSPTTAPASASPSAAPSATSTSQPSRSSRPTPAPTATRPGRQVGSVPEGAPDTGVPLTAGGSNGAVVAGELAAGAAVLGWAGVVVMRRRSKVRG
ncbi:MAG: hypothetical protein QOF84_1533, partial [Streptomyces sp.]|nr:hypothetical protein [Streptomyces sp.]